MVRYDMLTEWRFKAPPRRVWAVVDDVGSMAAWWPGIKKAQIRGAGKKLKPGTAIDLVVKGIIGDLEFSVEAVEVEPARKLLFKSSGDLKGFGLCTLEKEGDETLARLRWVVATTGWLMNLAGLVLKPLLKRRHDRVMAEGYKVLKKRLEG